MKIDKGVVVSWGRNIPRSSKLATEICFDEVYYTNKFQSRLLKPLDYIMNFLKTLLLLRSKKYSRFILVLPPTILLYSILFKRADSKIYVDLHNGILRREWRSFPFLSYLLKKTVSISHNDIVKERIDLTFDIDSVVLGDPLTIPSNMEESCREMLSTNKINVVIPLSYAKDEPLSFISELISQFNNDVNFILTGKAPSTFKSSLQDYCTFTGFVSAEKYNALLKEVDLVFCATNDDLIQMCALIEAISYSKPVMVKDNILNKSILKDYPAYYSDFSSGVEFINGLNNILEYSNDFDYSSFIRKFTEIRKSTLKDIFNDT